MSDDARSFLVFLVTFSTLVAIYLLSAPLLEALAR